MSHKNGNLRQEKKKPLSAGMAKELMEKNGMDFDGYELIGFFFFSILEAERRAKQTVVVAHEKSVVLHDLYWS